MTALIIGVVAGAIIGGAIGGTAAYNSAKESGKEGADLVLATAGGAVKGAAVGGVLGGAIGASGGAIAAGASTVAQTAIITSSATIMAKATEVSVLQAKKSTREGASGWQATSNCIDAMVSNGGRIVSPAFSKVGTTTGWYLVTDITKHRVIPLTMKSYLASSAGKIGAYAFVAYAWGHTIYSACCSDPVERATQRGYTLK